MTKPAANTLQAVLNRVKTQTEEEKPSTASALPPKRKKESVKAGAEEKPKPKPVRASTVLIGGHFTPEVAKQLRILAAEEGTTNQALLEHALDLLFVKKGKKRIADL
jgi:hypothetical protein